MDGAPFLYTGEVDLSGNECGFGTAIPVNNPNTKFEATFFNGKKHGFGMKLFTGWSLIYIFLIGVLTNIMMDHRWVDEFKNDRPFGKGSVYSSE